MHVHWIFYLYAAFIVVWVGFGIFLRLALRGMPWSSRLVVRLVFGAISFAVFGGGTYVLMEYVVNKGPDDVGVMWHAGTTCAAKLGSANNISYQVLRFTQDADGSGSGTYRISYQRDNQRGIVECHYDKATRKFDHDEVKERQ